MSQKIFLKLVTLAVLIVPAFAQPSVATNAVVNSASYAVVGLQNSSIAQGSIFTIFGTGLGASPQSPSGYPLPTNLGGTSVQITSGNSITNAILLYVSAGQLSAILPSAVPAGSASLTVTSNGQTSPPVPFQIVPSSFGLYTLNAQGNGNAVITDSQYTPFSQTYAANAGDVVTLWGTGLGPVSGDEASGPLPGNLAGLPVQVWVGTQAAQIAYQGRSGCCAGLDQIAFTVPAGTTGCFVPIAIQIGNIVSNFGTLAIASSGRVCADRSIPNVTSFLQNWSEKGSLTIGEVRVSRSFLPGSAGSPDSTFDSASGSFYSISSSVIPGGLPDPDYPPQGTCQVYPTFPTGAIPPTTPYLNAGASLSLMGVSGAVQLPLNMYGTYSYPNPMLFLDNGTSTFSGPGGTDIGSFHVAVTMPGLFDWTNLTSASMITESQGQLITWSGVDPANMINIQGYSQLQNGPGAGFSCFANTSDGQFQIPAFVLLSMPAGTSQKPLLIGTLSVSAMTAPVLFSATGMDFGSATAAYIVGTNSVTYK